MKLRYAFWTTTLQWINQRYGTESVATLSKPLGVYLLQVPDGVEVEELVEALDNLGFLEYALPNTLAVAPEAAPKNQYGWDPIVAAEDYLEQPALDLVRVSLADGTGMNAHDLATGSDVRVFVLDTGLYAAHPQLADSVPYEARWLTYDFVDDDRSTDEEFEGVDNDGDGLVDEAAGHGTFVAGIIHLVAPDADIFPLRVLDTEGYGNEFMIAEAINVAVYGGADIINLSFSMPEESALMTQALEYAASHDAVVVAAGGNTPDDLPSYPAANDGVLGVTSVNAEREKSVWAPFGSWLSFAAPGEDIVSTFADPDGGSTPQENYVIWSGTSIATPFVTGQAALVRSLRSDLSASEVAAVMTTTAQSIDAYNPGLEGLLGSGLPDVYDSLASLAAGGSTAPPE